MRAALSSLVLILSASISPVHAGAPSGKAPLPPSATAPEAAPRWELLATLPGWAAGLSGDVGIGGYAPVAVDVPFKDILESLEMVAALELEARYGRWGFVLNGLYLRMGSAGETPGRLLTSVDAQVEQVLAEAALAYRIFKSQRGYLDVLVGARYVHLETELNFHLDDAGVRSLSQDLSDRIVDRAVDAIRGEVSRTAARLEARLAALNLDQRAAALRQEVRTAAIERVLENQSLIDIIRAIRDLTPVEREMIKRKIEDSKEIIAANKALAQAVVEERVQTAVNGVRRRAQQAVERARKRLANAIDSAIREVVPESVAASKSWVDPFVGFRGRYQLTDKLYLAARGDIGGFGIASDLTWNVLGVIGYQWTEAFSTELGYRHLEIDYQDGGFVFDAAMSGVYLGMTLRL